MGKIPANTFSGVLPPYIGANSTDRAGTSPYEVEMSDLVLRYSTSPERVKILTGLIEYRKALTAIGVASGFQWIDGSFVEDVEAIRGRPPGDVDIVTFAHRPTNDPNELYKMIVSNPNLFEPKITKATYHCDAYFVDLSTDPALVVDDAAYWFGLFSHQRGTAATWKGMIKISLASDDGFAEILL